MTEIAHGSRYVRIPLTVVRGGVECVPNRSGLNWGQRPGRNLNQAYLPISAEIQRSEFFPAIGIAFEVECDDGAVFEAVRAQQNGKALETPARNSLIGEYFRNRLGVRLGEQVAIWHLIDYGRTSMEIFYIDGNRYFLDFASKKN